MLPQKTGSKVAVPSHDMLAKRWLEWDGFWTEACSDGFFIMRRDFPSRTLRCPEPYRPASVSRVHVVSE
jgi:hypothetical protein